MIIIIQIYLSNSNLRNNIRKDNLEIEKSNMIKKYIIGNNNEIIYINENNNENIDLNNNINNNENKKKKGSSNESN